MVLLCNRAIFKVIGIGFLFLMAAAIGIAICGALGWGLRYAVVRVYKWYKTESETDTETYEFEPV